MSIFRNLNLNSTKASAVKTTTNKWFNYWGKTIRRAQQWVISPGNFSRQTAKQNTISIHICHIFTSPNIQVHFGNISLNNLFEMIINTLVIKLPQYLDYALKILIKNAAHDAPAIFISNFSALILNKFWFISNHGITLRVLHILI